MVYRIRGMVAFLCGHETRDETRQVMIDPHRGNVHLVGDVNPLNPESPWTVLESGSDGGAEGGG